MRVGVSGRLDGPHVSSRIIFKRVSEFAAGCVGSASAHGVKLSIGLKIDANEADPSEGEVSSCRPSRRRATARNIDHTSHANNAVHDAVVRISSRLRKGMLINKAYIANSSRKAVHIVRGTIMRSRAVACSFCGITLVRLSPDSARTKNTTANIIPSQKIARTAFDLFIVLFLLLRASLPDFFYIETESRLTLCDSAAGRYCAGASK